MRATVDGLFFEGEHGMGRARGRGGEIPDRTEIEMNSGQVVGGEDRKEWKCSVGEVKECVFDARV